MNHDDDFVNDLSQLGRIPLLAIAWLSVFVLSWLLVGRILPLDALSIAFWLFFLLVALFPGVKPTNSPIKKPR